MEIKVFCNCGAKFKFDAQPVRGRMTATVNCPVCGADATELANQAIAEKVANAPAPVAIAVTPLEAAPMATATSVSPIIPPPPGSPPSMRVAGFAPPPAPPTTETGDAAAAP